MELLSQSSRSEAEDPEALELVEGQWSAAVWDASTTLQSKEAQLQLVSECVRQTQAAKATLRRLAEELEALKT